MSKANIVVIGGGVSGCLTVVNLMKQNGLDAAITIVEPREQFGLGLAYSTTCDRHLLNVPAAKMSLDVSQPDQFYKFALGHVPEAKQDEFLPRQLFGKYVQSLFQEALSSSSATTSVEAVKALVSDLSREQDRYRVELSSGDTITADVVVIAIGNLGAKKPQWLNQLSLDDPGFLLDPWDAKKISEIQSEERLLIVGAGLTAIDKLVEFALRDHKGQIHVVSRHGFFPMVHSTSPNLNVEQLGIREKDVKSAFSLVRERINTGTTSDDNNVAVQSHGGRVDSRWRDAVDSVRSETQDFWFNLPLKEKRRFMRHVQCLWDVHRHRMAPDIASVVRKACESGRVKQLSGRISRLVRVGSEIEVEIQLRGDKGVDNFNVERVINCTGPQASLRSCDSPLLDKMASSGVVAQHECGVGLNCDRKFHAIDSQGAVQPNLFVIGPLLKGAIFETVAVPELKVQAKEIAESIAKNLAACSTKSEKTCL